MLQKVKKLNPNIKTGYIIFMAVGDVSSLNVDFFSMEASVVTDSLIGKIRKLNKAIYVWTVNDADTMEKFIDLGVDNIITDNPKEVMKLLQEKQNTKQNGGMYYLLKLFKLLED